MPVLVAVDCWAFGRGWLGNTRRYLQMAEALDGLGWEFAVVTRRDNRLITRQVDEAFPGRVYRTPFSGTPRPLDFAFGRRVWGRVCRLFGREVPVGDRWAEHLTKWRGRNKPSSPLAEATLLCAVSYGPWAPLFAVKRLAEELDLPYCIDSQDPLAGTADPGEINLSDEQLSVLLGAKRVVTTAEAYAERLRESLPAQIGNVDCLRMTHNQRTLSGAESPSAAGRLLLLHAGNLRGQPSRSAIPLIRAVARLYDDYPPARGKVTLRLIGQGPGTAEAIGEAERLGVSSDLDCRDTVSPPVLQQHIDKADVLCILGLTDSRHNYRLQGKTCEYLFTDKPVLAVTYPGELAEIIQTTSAGWSVAPEDVEGLAAIFKQLLKQKETTGTVALERDPEKLWPYSREAFQRKLGEILAVCTEKPGSP